MTERKRHGKDAFHEGQEERVSLTFANRHGTPSEPQLSSHSRHAVQKAKGREVSFDVECSAPYDVPSARTALSHTSGRLEEGTLNTRSESLTHKDGKLLS